VVAAAVKAAEIVPVVVVESAETVAAAVESAETVAAVVESAETVAAVVVSEEIDVVSATLVVVVWATVVWPMQRFSFDKCIGASSKTPRSGNGRCKLHICFP
jgi:hypothetical protein